MNAQKLWSALAESVGIAVVGAHEPLRLLTAALLAGGHVLIEDVPGVGKTLLAKSFAKSLGLSFARVQGTPDLLPSDVTGSSILDSGAFRFVQGPVFNNVVLFDEINRATPRTQSALLEAMQERQASVDGTTHQLPRPFIVLATQNPIELEGTFALPEAQLDRFLVRVDLGYLSESDERQMLRRLRDGDDQVEKIKPVVQAADLESVAQSVRAVLVADEVEGYLLSIIRATREHADIRLGASPRSAVALYRTAQAWAALDGRDFVLPDDVRHLVRPVLAHRLVLDLDRELRGATRLAVLDEVLARTPVPVVEAA
ncbi:MAG: MoxR-like ATPase [Chloroflexota bacterium]|jgi:MoxR-like ATPase|nr:MoxR-like ATPase [Chloroflexota bacterium]